MANRVIEREARMMVLRSEIIRSDEMLTWLARSAAQTADYRYADRYDELLPSLDKAIDEALKLAPPAVREAVQSKTSKANVRLEGMEKSGIDFVEYGKIP